MKHTINTNASFFPKTVPAYPYAITEKKDNMQDFSDFTRSETIKEPTEFYYNDKVYLCFPYNYWDMQVDLNLFRQFVDCASVYISIFGTDIVETALKTLRLRDIVRIFDVEADMLFNYLGHGSYCLCDNHEKTIIITHNKNGWEKKEKVPGYSILGPSVRSLWEGKFLHLCLCLKFPYLTKFDFKSYSLVNSSFSELEDIYIKVIKKPNTYSIYVPIQALLENDFNQIVKHHTDYFVGYYRWPGGWGKDITKEHVFEWRQNNLDVLDSSVTHSLKEYMEGNKNVPEDEYKDLIFSLNIPETPHEINEKFILIKSINGAIDKPIIFKDFINAIKEIVSQFKDVTKADEPKSLVDFLDKYKSHFVIDWKNGKADMFYEIDDFTYVWTIYLIKV